MIYEGIAEHMDSIFSTLMMLVVFCPRRCSTSKNHFSYFCNKNNEKYTSAINKDKLQYSDRKMATGYDPLWEVIMSINDFFASYIEQH